LRLSDEVQAVRGWQRKDCRHYERIFHDVVDCVTAVALARRLVQIIARLVGGPVSGEAEEVTVDADRGEEE
jgi:hypothetical protein